MLDFRIVEGCAAVCGNFAPRDESLACQATIQGVKEDPKAQLQSSQLGVAEQVKVLGEQPRGFLCESMWSVIGVGCTEDETLATAFEILTLL